MTHHGDSPALHGPSLHRLTRIAAVVVGAVLFLGGTTGAPAQTPKLHLASDVWPPFTDTDAEARLALDLVETALERAGIASSMTIIDFQDLIPRIRGAEFDGSAALWRSPERERFLLYSEAYLENRLVLVGRKGSDVSATRLSELQGDRVALVEAYAYGEEVENARGPLFIRGSDNQANLQRLLEGQVDYMLVDELLIQYVLKHQESEAAEFLEIGTNPLVRRTLHFAIRKTTPRANTLIREFNAAIRGMLTDGTYNEILRLQWIRADVDGDGLVELVTGGAEAGLEAPKLSYSIVSPESGRRSQPLKITERFWLEGEVYEGWENVPERYKIPSGTFDLGPPSNSLVFKFRF